MKIREAIKEVNKDVVKFIEHDHWELRLGFSQIKQGLREVFNGIKNIARWSVASLAYPLMPILYPIAILIRVFKK